MIVPVRKYACGNLACGFFGLLKDPDIWPATCGDGCGGFIWPNIPCHGCGQNFETAAERFEEVLYGWTPGIAQFGAGPLSSPGTT